MSKFKPFVDDPVCSIQWLSAATLNANAWNPNAWNPNVVLTSELRLLERSILRTGWIQPLLVARSLTIIDGYHRWRLALESVQIRARYADKVPCAVLDVSDAEAKIITVRINRAKGTHVAVRMAELVQSLIDEHGYSPDEVALGIGADPGEVDLLYQNSIFKARNLADAPYSKAWYPAESKHER